MIVRAATLADAEIICTVLRASITELCAQDHSNKTALRLYASLGYIRDDAFASVSTSGVTAIPLSKSLHRSSENVG